MICSYFILVELSYETIREDIYSFHGKIRLLGSFSLNKGCDSRVVEESDASFPHTQKKESDSSFPHTHKKDSDSSFPHTQKKESDSSFPHTQKNESDSSLPHTHKKESSSKTKQQDAEFPLGIQQFLWRGTTLKNTDWITGIVVYTGKYCRILRTANLRRLKYSQLLQMYNKHAIVLACTQVGFLYCSTSQQQEMR
jgi:hypothetical protein